MILIINYYKYPNLERQKEYEMYTLQHTNNDAWLKGLEKRKKTLKDNPPEKKKNEEKPIQLETPDVVAATGDVKSKVLGENKVASSIGVKATDLMFDSDPGNEKSLVDMWDLLLKKKYNVDPNK